MVTHIVSRMIYDSTEREDLAQEVFLKVHENLGGFRFRSRLSTWIARITYHTCLNFLEKKRPSLIEDDFPERGGADAFPGTAPPPDAAVHRAEVAGILEREIRSLPVKHRTALTLFHMEGLSYEEIGEVMGLPDGTVKSYLFRARKELYERLTSAYSREDLES
jgi:RNA polymerase sigma factor (sigma-70 family)